ncbi:MAG: hypothetical protein DYG93_11725 [Leptolyngbya sp. PLA2]|nr:hypothetical protein [Leptolyngbya sp.]MCE7972314.1 hypothetical protein [Leptolyngbya sp. PL-A2]MCQ3939494.1 hypothetical protein [cyanobacterium CYA1]MCZ7632250.1 hypothetical protein [Phycisphaerales bacterium]MDL1903752.1 hypothetical protein [Synechococcales cyanobacterium CNB]GIK18476.1 MAG: hypothetical protein BroJett004_06400 [Planctomycetota bacterium]
MKKFWMLSAVFVTSFGRVVFGQATPVNAMCPIGKEPIVASAGTVEYKGLTIGLCCPGCGEQFLSWDEARKDEFVALARARREPGQEQHGANAEKQPETGAAADAEPWTDLYTLGTCPISGRKLGSMGDPVVKRYDGREVRFCCSGCIERFEADPAAAWKKVDEAMIKDQRPFYPLETCVVSDEPLKEDGRDVATEVVFNNRLVRLCCRSCVKEFRADPRALMKKLDKAAADAQRKDYPLTTCIVAGGELGSMGEPSEMVVAGRLLRFCCASCHPKVKADPLRYLRIIDEAWRAKGRYLPERAADEPARENRKSD